MSEAFVYCWTDKKTNMLYVGSHKGSIDDGYICSSKYMLEQYNKRQEDFSRQIIAEGDLFSMRKLETSILQSVNASKNPDYYNMHNNNGSFILIGHTEKTKLKMRKPKSEETKKKLSDARKKLFERGYITPNPALREEVRLKMSISAKKRTLKTYGRIKTPYGIFDSLRSAASAENISYNKIRNKVNDKTNLNYERVK